MLHVVEDPSELYQTFLDNKHDSKDMDMKNMRKQLDEQFQVILEELNVR